jgi:hypothetical protein
MEHIIWVDLTQTQTEENWQISGKIYLRYGDHVVVEFRNINKHIWEYTLPRGSYRWETQQLAVSR